MSIVAGDIDFYLSGGSSNTDPDAALGGDISNTQVVDNTLENLFSNITGVQHTAGRTVYRCIFVKNANVSDTAYSAKIYIDTNTPGTDSAANIGLDLTGKGTTADTIANETTAPDPAVSFSTADGYANALDLGDLAAGESYPVWCKLIISAGSTAQANDNFVLKVSVDTA